MRPADPIVLNHEGWILQVSRFGGCVLSCVHDGQDMLRPTQKDWDINPDPVLASCFPLVPFSNRIANGKFSFEGEDISIPLTRLSEPHPLHGYGWISEWDVTHHSGQHIEILLDYVDGDWPWPFRCRQSFRIENGNLKMSLILENTGAGPMPAGLGFHPFFSNAKTATLKFEAQGYWEADDNVLPTHWRSSLGESDFASGKPVTEHAFDNCFTDWDGKAEMTWSDRPHRLEVRGSENLSFAVLYTPQGQDYFCFEPVSHMNNAVSFTDDDVHTGLKTLAPGDTFSASMMLKCVLH